jgi:hypothetical protein
MINGAHIIICSKDAEADAAELPGADFMRRWLPTLRGRCGIAFLLDSALRRSQSCRAHSDKTHYLQSYPFALRTAIRTMVTVPICNDSGQLWSPNLARR